MSGITGANQKKATPHTKEERIQRFSEAPYDVTITTVSEEIKSNFGWTWWLLTVDGHKIDSHIENSNIYESEKEEYKDKLKDIRNNYKVEKVQKSDPHIEYEFINEKEDKIDSKRLTQIYELAKAASEGARAGANRQPGTEHEEDLHEDMTETLISNEFWWEFSGGEYSRAEKDKLKEGSSDPDQEDSKCFNCSTNWIWWMETEINESLVNGLEAVIRSIDENVSPHHMYLPNPSPPLRIPLGPLPIDVLRVSGAADIECDYHFTLAQQLLVINETELAAEQLGRAMHFLQDCSVPFHTGAVAEQIGLTREAIAENLNPVANNAWVHYDYEEYIDDNWDSGKEFKSDYLDGASDERDWEGSVDEQITTMAGLSELAADDLFDTIFSYGENHPEEWADEVEEQTGAYLWFLGKYDAGMVDEILL